MVQHSYGDSGKVLNNEYHAKRREAEFESFSIGEWDDLDIERYDLDTIPFSRKYLKGQTEARVETEGASKDGIDVRTL